MCGDDICAIGYNESTVIHKKRKCICKKDKYFQSKIGLLEGELHNSDNILYCYSQVDSLTVPILEEVLKKNKLMRYKRDIYNLYFALTKKKHLHDSVSGNVRKPRCILNS